MPQDPSSPKLPPRRRDMQRRLNVALEKHYQKHPERRLRHEKLQREARQEELEQSAEPAPKSPPVN